MITKGRAIEEMLRWMDEASINGEKPAPEHLADYRDRAAYLLNGVVSLLAQSFRIPASHTVIRNPIKNLLGDDYKLISVTPEEAFIVEVSDGCAVYLEVMGDVSVSICRGGAEVFGCEESSDGEFTPIQVAQLPGDGKISIAVESEYPAMVRNPAVYAVPFPFDEDVQPWSQFVYCNMPANFREYEKCIYTSDGSVYQEMHDVRREGFNTFVLPSSMRGQFVFHYWRNPRPVPYDAPEGCCLEVAPEAEALVGLKLAADVARGMPEMQNVAYWLDAEFAARTNNLARQERGGITAIQPVYSMY